MNTPSNPSQGNPAGRSSGEAGGQRQGLRQPSDDERTEDKLGNVDLESRGAKVDDHLRDRDSKGVAGGYDDSIDREERPGDKA
ncbi:MAG: hypothetical protein ACREO4_01745 [Lysobacter sp.]